MISDIPKYNFKHMIQIQIIDLIIQVYLFKQDNNTVEGQAAKSW